VILVFEGSLKDIFRSSSIVLSLKCVLEELSMIWNLDVENYKAVCCFSSHCAGVRVFNVRAWIVFYRRKNCEAIDLIR